MPCPRCHSRNVKVIDEELPLLRCLSCGYNELKEEEEESAVADSRKSQREKGRFSQYKIGGKGRVRK